MINDNSHSVRSVASLAVYLLIGSIAIVAISGVAGAHCEPPSEHSTSIEWETGGSSPDEAKAVTTSTNITFDGSGSRWFRIYVDDGQAIVPDHYCIWDDTEVTIYEERTKDSQIGSWKGHDPYEPDLPVLESGWYYLEITPDMISDEENGISFDTAQAQPDDFEIQRIDRFPEELSGSGEMTFVPTIRKDAEVSDYDASRDRYGPFTDEAIVTLLVNGQSVDSERISVDANEQVQVDLSYEFTPDDSGDNDVAIRVRPHWADSFIDESLTVPIETSDIDGDGLTDTREEALGTDIANPDTDGDGLTDGTEAEGPTDPLRADTDGDGLDDDRELEIGSDPTERDTDGDGLDDSREVELGSDPTVADTDGDELTDDKEVEIGTDPTRRDTDDDGLADKREVEAGTDPTTADSDDDGLPDPKELELGTDPKDRDTDGDGVSDYDEFQQGTDPLSDTDVATKQVKNDTQVLEDRELQVEEDHVDIFLKTEKTIITPDEPAILTFSGTTLVSAREPVTIQLILEVPSGMSVSGTNFVDSGSGQYTTTMTLDPGETEGLRIEVDANELGRASITGRTVYYLGDDRENATSRQVAIPVEVVGEPNADSESDGNQSSVGSPSDLTPGFGIGSALFGIILLGGSVRILRRRNG